MEQLTTAPGYDAEATVAFDGSKIIHTSMAGGDLDIWTMDLDGNNKVQLTDELGYDGGLFLIKIPRKLFGESIIQKAQRKFNNIKICLLKILYAQRLYKFGLWILMDQIKNK